MILISLGCDPSFVSDLLGDLHEEYQERAAKHGVIAAKLWYVREIVRSSPHILLNAVRKGNSAARARLAAFILAAVATLSLVTAAWVTRNGPPARLVAAEDYSDGIVVNNLRPVQLAIGVLDAAGHRLNRTDVRYRRVSGSALQISPRGTVRCTQRGDAIVRATLGALNKNFVVHCEPIKEIRGVSWANFFVGDPPRPLIVDAIGIDGEPVTRIAARLRVDDSTVATLNGGELRPLRHGITSVEADIGDVSTATTVIVFERVATFEGLRPDQRWVVAPIHLTRRQFVRWPLPVGDFFLAFTSSGAPPATRGFGYRPIGTSKISMTVAGPIMCMPELKPGIADTHCLARGPGATLTIANPDHSRFDEIVGMIALERWQRPETNNKSKP